MLLEAEEEDQLFTWLCLMGRNRKKIAEGQGRSIGRLLSVDQSQQQCRGRLIGHLLAIDRSQPKIKKIAGYPNIKVASAKKEEDQSACCLRSIGRNQK